MLFNIFFLLLIIGGLIKLLQVEIVQPAEWRGRGGRRVVRLCERGHDVPTCRVREALLHDVPPLVSGQLQQRRLQRAGRNRLPEVRPSTHTGQVLVASITTAHNEGNIYYHHKYEFLATVSWTNLLKPPLLWWNLGDTALLLPLWLEKKGCFLRGAKALAPAPAPMRASGAGTSSWLIKERTSPDVCSGNFSTENDFEPNDEMRV